MHADDLLIYDGADRHAIEAIYEGFPYLYIIPRFTLLKETVYFSNWGWLMITSQQIHVTFVFYFKGKEQANGFDALPSSINVVTKEKIAALWRHTSVLKQS
jgi:hypothetical protein